MDYRKAIQRYYRAFRERDRATLEALLVPDFHFVSSFKEYHDRDAMLDDIWPSVGKAWATNLRTFGVGPEIVVLYEQETTQDEGRPGMSMAECVRFDGERIAAIEVFVGRARCT